MSNKYTSPYMFLHTFASIYVYISVLHFMNRHDRFVNHHVSNFKIYLFMYCYNMEIKIYNIVQKMQVDLNFHYKRKEKKK